jgi:hypothetical protein
VDGDILAMGAKERERAHVIRQVADRQTRAAEQLGIGIRQVNGLMSAYRRRGDRGPDITAMDQTL